MSTKSKIAIGVGVLAGTLIAAGGAIAVVNVAFDSSRTERFTIAEPVQKLVVDGRTGDIRVVATDRRDIDVQQTIRWVHDRPESTRAVSGGVLKLTDGCEDDMYLFRCETGYRIEVPRGLALEIEADAGNIHIAGATGVVSAETDAGDVEGEDLAAARVRATTDAGNVELEFASAPASLDAETDAGDVELVLPRAEYKLDLDTDAGSTSVDDSLIRYDLADHVVRGRTDAGDITVKGR